MINPQEAARIRQRLTRGNSPRRIALDYPDSPNILADIYAIQGGRPRGATDSDETEIPSSDPVWFKLLDGRIKHLVRECCAYHDLSLSDLMAYHKGSAARSQLCYALRHRWAMGYEEMSELLGLRPQVVCKLANRWTGKVPALAPEPPKMPTPIAPLVRALAGEYGTTEWAIVKGIGQQNVATAARNHLSYKLYTERGEFISKIARWLKCSHATVRDQIDGHARSIGLTAQQADALNADAKTLGKTGKAVKQPTPITQRQHFAPATFKRVLRHGEVARHG
ncbi:hypothetical protein [Cohaesibacter celericrescens]|uniref:Uncharacterized protein n=1 Tax=Cohaesibacter celericrescens TaxID=2067669 RepID=A0A2N5XX59_9HYPH|nr:hypothetical protein [Cohaesibacter celericrescens]PLW79090.1 hypothetical protein C0081_02335 [Cohaesibacter celericrescens]